MRIDNRVGQISFTYNDGRGRSIDIKNAQSVTWMDLADDFVGFLNACGYQCSAEDVAMHLGSTLVEYEANSDQLSLYP